MPILPTGILRVKDQNPNGIFTEIEPTFLTFFETKKTAKALLKKKNTGGIRIPDFQLHHKLQPRQAGTGTNTDTGQWEQDRALSLHQQRW